MTILDYLKKYQNIYFFTKSYLKKQIVFNENDYCDKIGFLLSGQLSISSITFSEKEEIITIVNPLNWFGEFLAFSKNPYYLGNGIVLKNATIAFINISDLKKLCLEDAGFFEIYLKMLCEKTLEIKTQAKLFCHKNIRDRIMYYFLHLARLNNSNIIEIASIENLSQILALPRPSVSRELTKMQQEKLIKKEKKTITLLKGDI